MTLSKKECRHIMAPALDACLPAIGLNRHFPRAVLYGPTSLQGLGVTNVYNWQGAIKLQTIQSTTTGNDPTGFLIKCSLELLKVELGIGGNPFMRNGTNFIKYATPTWLTDIWKFTSENNLRLKDNLANLELRRENDRFLMEMATSMDFTNGQLKKINGCRLFLQVTTLSDITSGDGTFIHRSYWEGKKNKDRQTLIRWP